LENRLTLVSKMDGNLNTEYSVEYQYCPGCSGSRTARIKRDGDGEILSWYRYEEQGINTLRVDEKYDSDSDQFITDDDQWRVQRYTKATKEIVLAYPHGEAGIPSATDELVYATDRAGTVQNAFDDAGLLAYGSRTEQDSFGAEMNGSWGDSSVTKHNWGSEYDSDVALYYFGGKRSWFSPERGMYLQHGSGYSIIGPGLPDIRDPGGNGCCCSIADTSIGGCCGGDMRTLAPPLIVIGPIIIGPKVPIIIGGVCSAWQTFKSAQKAMCSTKACMDCMEGWRHSYDMLVQNCYLERDTKGRALKALDAQYQGCLAICGKVPEDVKDLYDDLQNKISSCARVLPPGTDPAPWKQ